MLVQQDAPRIIRQSLRALIAVPVRSELPSGWSPRDGPAVTVVGDGTPHTELAWTRENVRVCVYAASEPDARQLANLVDAYLLDPATVRGLSIFPGAGLIATRDQSLGCWIAAITVRAAANRKDMNHG